MSDVVNRGSEPNDNSSDTLFEAFGKINEAFDNAQASLNDKVDKIPGKGLSTDDFIESGNYPNLRAGATTKDDVELGNVQNYGIATEVEAKTATANNKYMTPQRTSDFFMKKINYGTADPTGGSDGDIYLQYED